MNHAAKKGSPALSETATSRLSMLSSAALMGSVGIFVDFLSKYSTFTVVFFRGLFGILFLTIAMLRTRLFSMAFLREIFSLVGKSLLLIALVNPLVIFFYFATIRLSNYALAAFLLYTSGLSLLLFLTVSRERKHLTKINVVSFFLAVIGIVLIMEIWSGTILFLNTVIIGLISGLLLAVQIFLKKWLYSDLKKSNYHAEKLPKVDIFLTWWALLALVCFFMPFGALDLFRMTPIDLLYGFLLGLIPTALAFVLYNKAIKHDRGGNIAILAYFEPLVATIFSILLQQQSLSIFTLLGGLFILLANILILKSTK